MKLHGHNGKRLMDDAFVRSIVHITKPFFESFWYFFYRKAVILGSQKASVCIFFNYGLILASVPEFHFISRSSGSQCENLIAQANAKYRGFLFQKFFYI